MIKCYLSIGSNDGDREARLREALDRIAEISLNCYVSTTYESPALPKSGSSKISKKISPKDPHSTHYLNAVALIEYDGELSTLESHLKQLEFQAGRSPELRAQGRVPLDIDIVIADSQVLRPRDFSLYFFRQGYEELLPLHP